MRIHRTTKRMKLLAAATVLLLSTLAAWSAPEQPSLPGAYSSAIPDKPAPQLLALEHKLSEQQEAQKAGILPVEQYQVFIAQFRTDLDAVMSRLPPVPANTARYTQILSRLGVRESAQALAVLRQAHEATPDDPGLLRAESEIQLERKDFPAAASSALKAWEASGHTDKAAWALYQMSKDRAAPSGTNVKPADLSRPVTASGTSASPDPAMVVAKSLLGNLPTPPAPAETTSETTGNSPGNAVKIAFAAAATATGGIILFLGLGGRTLEEKLPGIRMKLGIAAALGGVIILGAASIPRLAPTMLGNPVLTERERDAASTDVMGALRGGQPSFQRVAQSLPNVAPQASASIQRVGADIATRASPLLNGRQAEIDIRKFTEYALNPMSEDGMHKAKVFKAALGYTRDNFQGLIDQIRTGILSNPAIKGTMDKYGARYTVDIVVSGPGGQAVVRTGWNYQPGSEIPRLTTLFVKK